MPSDTPTLLYSGCDCKGCGYRVRRVRGTEQKIPCRACRPDLSRFFNMLAVESALKGKGAA